MIYLRLSSIEAERPNRPDGYCEEVIASGKIEGEHLVLSPEAFEALLRRFSPHRAPPRAWKRFLWAMARWVRAGFPVVQEWLYWRRKPICQSCPEWQRGSRLFPSRCRLCGCATEAKLRMATESCPLGKW
jgi:hypothetical protein